MTDHELLIIGGGPAGLAAARGYRDAGGQGPVAIVTDEERMPYRRPPLTKELLRGELSESELPLEDERWLADHGVALISGRAVALEDREHRVKLSGGRMLSYGSCLLATGSEPTRPPIPGIDDPAVRVVRTLAHVRELLARLGDRARVVVIGSGFIGCELAASLTLRGHRVTMISDETAPNEARLGAEVATIIAGWLAELGVELMLGAGAEAIERRDGEIAVSAGGHRVRAQLAVAATGVAPRSELIAGAGALVGGAIPTDAGMRTALPGLLAAGDVAYALNATAGRRLRVEHWGDALGQGAVAGRTAAGEEARWEEVPGFWSTIGAHTLKYAAWGDGHDELAVTRHDAGAFTVHYGRGGRQVGLLCHNADGDYERGRAAIAGGEPWS